MASTEASQAEEASLLEAERQAEAREQEVKDCEKQP